MSMRISVALALVLAVPVAVAQTPLTLSQAVEQALSQNERAAIAGADLEVAEARLRKARSYFFPNVDVSASYRHRPEIVRSGIGTIREADQLSADAELRLTVFDARSVPVYTAAKRARDAQRLASVEQRRRLAFSAADAFLVTLGAEQVLAATERRVGLARRTIEDVRVRRKVAIVGANDVTKAELELATAEREAARARAEAAHTRLTLGLIIGTPVTGALVPPAELGESDLMESSEMLVTRAKSLRLDRRAADLRADAAERIAAEPLLRALPTLALVGQYSVTSAAGFTGQERDWFVGADLLWTLYDGGERYADHDERRAQARIAQLEAATTQRSLAVEVRRAKVFVDAARAAAVQAAKAADAAHRNANEVLALYREGLATALDVADAAARAFEADVALAGERYSQGRSVLDLRLALGLDASGRELTP